MRLLPLFLIVAWTACSEPPADNPPLALLNAPSYCQLGATVEFDGSHSTDPDEDIVLYRFYIADGASALELSRPILLYTCRTPGLIEIMLEVEDSRGNRSTSRALLSVRP